MANNFSSPGVSINEIDKSQTISLANKNVAIVAIPSEIGYTNEVIYVETEADLISQFGKPTNNNYQEWYSALTLIQYGVTVGVIRPNDTTVSLATANVDTSTPGFTSGLQLSGRKDYELGTNNYIFAAQSPTDLYNGLSVAIVDHGADQILTVTPVSGGYLGAPLAAADIVFSGSNYGWIYNSVSFATDFTVILADSKKKFKVGDTLLASDNTTVIGTITATTDYYSTQYIAPNIPWTAIAPQPGTSQQAKERGALFDEFHAVVIDTLGKISGNVGAILETYTYLSKASDGLSSEGSDTYWLRQILNKSKYIFPGTNKFNLSNTITLDIPTLGGYVAGDIGDPIQNKLFKVLKTTSGGCSIKLTLAGGTSYNWTTVSVIDSAVDSAYDLVADAETFGDVDFLIPGKITAQRVNKLTAICENRRDCRVATAPKYSDVVNNSTSTVKVNNIIDFFDTLPSSSFLILCDNYKYIFDKYNNTYRYIPCSADVAGLTLTTLNPWQSPAGSVHGVLKNAIKLAYSAKQTERDRLYTKRINPIISFPGKGVILNGDKTALSSPSAFDRIGVRGLMIELQKVISRYAENQLFEINDDTSRKNFVDTVTPYLQNIQANRGVYEYKVVCDSTNNSPQDIDANKFTADIYIKPSRSINFIVLNFITTATGASFTVN
jgi:hypothetical protein